MEDFVAGALGGATGLLIGHPFEVLKVQLQVSSGRSTGGSGPNLRDSISAMLNRGVSSGLFRGMALPMASFAAVNSVFFGVYGHILTSLETRRPDGDFGNIALAGMAGGAAQLPLVAPVEVVKTALQAQLTRATKPSEFFKGPLDCASHILRREGPRGLYRGFWLNFVRDVPSYGLYMLVYVWLERRLAGQVKNETAATLLAGAFAGSASWLVVLPIDTVKSNLQADAGSEMFGSQRRTTVSVTREVYQSYGARGFFRGSWVVMLRSLPVNAVTFFVWSRVLRFLKSEVV